MSTEAVKKQLLVAISALNLPLDSSPSAKRVGEACAAAKLLRNRLLREHTRVQEFIEDLRQKQLYDEDAEGDEEEGDDSANALSGAADSSFHKCARTEFIFLAEMMLVEKLVVPLLLAHGMKFSDTLLPQLLKLLTAMLQPIPRFCADETLQKDLLKRCKSRCGTDELFALLVQSVAPVAEKRAAGSLQREDVVLLEVVLTLITHLLDGRPQDMENNIGSFCRNHGIELLLVVINQNFSRIQQKAEVDSVAVLSQKNDEDKTAEAELSSQTNGEQLSQVVLDANEEEHTLTPTLVLNDTSTLPAYVPGETQLSVAESVHLLTEDDEKEEESDEEEEITDEEDGELQIQDATTEMQKQFEEKVLDLLESDEQIWKWNCLAMTSIANVFNCVCPTELAQLSFLGQMNVSSPEQLLNLLRGGSHFRDCRKETDNWRFIARSRHGAMNSNSVVVRLDPENRPGTVGGRAIGTVSSLFGTRRKDPLENIKDMDLRKRGRFVKGMFQDSTPRCDLPLPTKIVLSQQSQSFLCFGFEPLNTMTWQRLQEICQSVERAAKEHKEALSGFKNSDERMEITSPLAPELYQEFSDVLHYMTICGNLLHYIREVARLMKQDNVSFATQHFQQQWQSLSSIISLDHLEGGFAVLRSFLECRDLRRRCDVLDVVNYLAELLFMLNLILEKEVVDDPAVDVAAHALASSVLYKEENIKTVFDLLNEYANRNLSVPKSQSLTLFVFAVFQLMERCSYNGSLLLPKRPKRKGNMIEAGDDGHEDDDDKESVNSALLEEMEREMVEQMADMIDDDSSSDRSGSIEGASNHDDVVSPTREQDDVNSDEQKKVFEEQNNKSPDAAATAITRNSGEAALPATATGVMHSDNAISQDEAIDVVDQRPRAESSARAPSEAHPPSVASLASSGRTALSTISSEREVAVGSYLRRLATPKNMGLLYSALRHWRINDVDVNLGLTYLMERLVNEGCESAFFNIAFLLLFRDVLMNGKRTHGPLYAVSDRLVYDFFNPSFARTLDYRTHSLFDENDINVLSGSQSFLGFEVALRCSRSLFNFAAGDYDVLEEKAMPHLMDYTAIPLDAEQQQLLSADHPTVALAEDIQSLTSEHPRPAHASGDEWMEVTEDMVQDERAEPRRKKHRRDQDRSRGDADGREALSLKKKRGKHRRRTHSEENTKSKKAPKIRGPQPPDKDPSITDAAAEEEDKMFQALMAAIAPTATLPSREQPVSDAAAPKNTDDEDEAILLLQ